MNRFAVDVLIAKNRILMTRHMKVGKTSMGVKVDGESCTH